VKGTVSGTATVYIAGIYERQGAAYTSYYEGGGLRRSGYSSNNGVFYMLSDHLKSTSALVARNGVLNVKYFYFPYGARRGVPFNTITAKHFTGQYHETSLPGGEGLSFYNARWYDPKLGSFLSADSIVPAPLDPQSLNRYAYAGGNPLRFSDPSGHTKLCGAACEDGYKWSPVTKKGTSSSTAGGSRNGSQSSAKTQSPQTGGNVISTIDRLRRAVTNPMLGGRNVARNAAAIGLYAYRYQVDPVMLASIVYYESDAIERLPNNITGSGLLDFDLWKFVLTGNSSIGLGQVRIDTAINLERIGLVSTTPSLPFVGNRSLVALRLSHNGENIRYVAANLRDIQNGVKENSDGLGLTEDQMWTLTIQGYNVGRQEIVDTLVAARAGDRNALAFYLNTWGYATDVLRSPFAVLYEVFQ
jgi:RHS repeat-associated protein